MIEVAGLVRKFGDFTAVDHIDFQVNRGEIFGLLGPNGAGKSTTFKMLCGLLPPSDGKALVLGIDLRRAAAIARGHIGYMAQKFSLYGNMSVLQNLRFFASAYGLTGGAQSRRIETELTEFGLTPYVDTISDTLPLGYKQRLSLACAHHARARRSVPRRADVRGGPPGAAGILGAYQCHGSGRGDGHGHNTFHGGGRVL